MLKRPNPTQGVRHLALYVKNFEECEFFYTELLGMKIEWRPDADNLYLSSGSDNLALHRAPLNFAPSHHQHLDHFGFFLAVAEDVDEWFAFLSNKGVVIKSQPKDHRDKSRSFYCADPDGNIIQMIYYPFS